MIFKMVQCELLHNDDAFWNMRGFDDAMIARPTAPMSGRQDICSVRTCVVTDFHTRCGRVVTGISDIVFRRTYSFVGARAKRAKAAQFAMVKPRMMRRFLWAARASRMGAEWQQLARGSGVPFTRFLVAGDSRRSAICASFQKLRDTYLAAATTTGAARPPGHIRLKH